MGLDARSDNWWDTESEGLGFRCFRLRAVCKRFDIAVRSGGHCAPLMHHAPGTGTQGAVRFSFSQFNTMEEVQEAVKAMRILAWEG